MPRRFARPAFALLLLTGGQLFLGCNRHPDAAAQPKVPEKDEAKKLGLTAEAFRYPVGPNENYLAGMDGVAVPQTQPDQLMDPAAPPGAREVKDIVSTPNEILGRNTWMLWCGGNEGFWDWLAKRGYGFSDLLKVIDSRYRSERFNRAGLINEPGMKQALKKDEYGLWLDEPEDEFQRKEKAKVPRGIYGRSTGVVGLRLFPNPDFEKAKARWDPDKYYNDPSYYTNPGLIRPYRVGMSCAFCHASWHPLKPPLDVNRPQWENISGNIGAQYLRMRAVFGNLLKEDNFVYHLLDSQPPGTIDTSLIASDNINNPNAMNAIFNVPQRVVRSFVNPPEVLSGDSVRQPAVWGNPREMLERDSCVWRKEGNRVVYEGRGADKVPKPYWDLLQGANLLERVKGSNEGPRYVPRVLFDGADSIGAWGALARVYLNIGTYWEQWIHLHNPLVGLEPQRPFKIKDCEQNSVYWEATQERVAPLRDYFLKISGPMPLLAAQGSSAKTAPIDPGALVPNEKWKVLAGREQKIGAPPPFVKTTLEKAEAASTLAREKGRRIDVTQLARGRKVFANNCIACHSSVQWPERDRILTEEAYGREGAQKKPVELWDHDPGRWMQDPGYKAWAEAAVETPEFWRDNYLSSDYRVPISLVRTNSARGLATNALGKLKGEPGRQGFGHMWEDFSSESYKKMPFVGEIRYFDPFDGKEKGFTPKHHAPEGSPIGGGGIGFYRPPTLVSIWTTAPLLHNNSLGLFNNNPSVDGRLDAFDDAIRKLLWPAKRLESSSFNEATPERLKKDHGLIWRTPRVTYLTLPGEQVPQILAKVPFLTKWTKAYSSWIREHPFAQKLLFYPWLPSAVLFVIAYLIFVLGGRRPSRDPATVLHRKWWARAAGYLAVFLGVLIGALLYTLSGKLGEVRIGPIPKGTPVNLLANANPDADPVELKRTIKLTLQTLTEIDSKHLRDEEANKLMREKIAPALMKVSKCPDFVMDEGHYFEWFDSMTEEDKNALIELLKTF
jgi:mono/diheme cytochrome c family protein